MHQNLQYIGHIATFYLPANKHELVKNTLHEFLISNYQAYTVEASEIKGYWRSNPNSPLFTDHNIKYVVSFDGRERVPLFVDFLAKICNQIDEQCLYLTMGQKSFLVHRATQ